MLPNIERQRICRQYHQRLTTTHRNIRIPQYATTASTSTRICGGCSAEKTVTALSLDGGKARLRTDLGEASEWRDYKAVALHHQQCAAFFQENNKLLDWVNRQPR